MNGKEMSTTFGLALSGGGARGLGHIGTAKVLLENGISFSRIAGTSAGAIVASFLAAGYEPDEILDIAKKTKLMFFIRPALSTAGLLKLEIIEDILNKYLPNTFEELKIPLTVAATNLKLGKNKYFYKGGLIRAILASCAVPVIFRPIQIEGTKYIDGGILNNLPVDPLIGQCDRIVGCNCNAVSENFEDDNIKSLMERSLLMAINVNTYVSRDKCDTFIEPEGMRAFGAFEFNKAEDMVKVCYDYTKQHIDQILRELM